MLHFPLKILESKSYLSRNWKIGGNSQKKNVFMCSVYLNPTIYNRHLEAI